MKDAWVALRLGDPEKRHVLDGPAWAHASPIL